MGSWGKAFYENDTALDVVDEINSIFADERDNRAACKRILSMLKSKYTDADDQSIAWLAAADQLIPRSGALVSALYKSIQESSAALPDETIRMLEEKIGAGGRKPRQKRAKKPESTWKTGEIYCCNIEPAYASVPALKDYTIGFLCIDFYRYAGVHPIVYVFRSNSSMEEIRANPSIVLSSDFWRTCKWDDGLFEYRAVLWADKADEVPAHRLHACGRINVLPEISDEFIVQDIVSYPHINFSLIEDGLLRTRVLMHNS